MSLTGAADLIYTFRFLRLLTQSWEDTAAYKAGVIDKDGNALKKPNELKTKEEKDSYTLFHRLVFNLKRLINKVPGGKSKLASYAAALFLIKEHTGMTEEQLTRALSKAGWESDDTNLTESWLMDGEALGPGKYVLTNNIVSPATGEMIAGKGTSVVVYEDTQPVDTLFNAHVYQVEHLLTRQKVFITVGDIKR